MKIRIGNLEVVNNHNGYYFFSLLRRSTVDLGLFPTIQDGTRTLIGTEEITPEIEENLFKLMDLCVNSGGDFQKMIDSQSKEPKEE